jgi:hypothetical protein
MKITLLLAFLFCFFVSCSGPVFVAKTEQEGIRGSYQDPKLGDLSMRNQQTLSDIYRRYQLANIDIYPNGIGFSTLSGDDGKKYYYLLVDVRPRDITFGEALTTPDQRFSEVYNHHLENNLRYINSQDLEKTGVDGLAFAVHWPVRDLSQCDTYGGFLEYVMIYLSKADFFNYANGQRTFAETVRKGEVYRSLNRKNPEAVRVVQGE